MTVIGLASPRRWRQARGRTALFVGESTSSYYLLATSTGILILLGLLMILSASSVAAYAQYGSSFLFFRRQVMWILLGLVVMVILSRVDYHRLRPFGWILSAAALIGLGAVLHPAIGIRAGGSSRWLSLGPLNIQPSELMKLAVLILAADVIARKQGHLHRLRDIVLPLGLVVVTACTLVMLQPDLGTTLLICLIAFAVVFVGGTSLPLIGAVGLAGAAGAAGLAFAEGYRRARIFSFLDPFSDPLNSGYQAVQSMIALGSGGLFGVGLGQSRQKWLYVPNAHTDFIFAILGEELGIIGTFAVVGLFLLIGYTGIKVAVRAPDAFGRLLAGGATAWIVGQGIVNMGAVTGLLPITGVPLPFVSFGGSAMVFTLAAVGILCNVARQERSGARITEGEE